MIPLEKVVSYRRPNLQGKADRDILLSRIIDHLKANKHDRLPLFVDNKGSGPAKCVIELVFDKITSPTRLSMRSLARDSANLI